MKKRIYVPIQRDGSIPISTKKLIAQNMVNDLARNNVDRALQEGRKELDYSHIYIMEYGGVELYFFSLWTEARYTRIIPEITFLNQEEYDSQQKGFNTARIPLKFQISETQSA